MNYDKKVELYEKLIVKSGFKMKGKTVPYTSANGHMFSQLNKNGELGIRFSKEVQEKYISELNTTTFKSYGATMKGYILIPDEMWSDLNTLAKYLQESYSYVMSFDPK
jgi:hypothetical protein